MYDYFNDSGRLLNKFFVAGGFSTIKEYHVKEIEKIQKYFLSNKHAVSSQHYLMRVLISVSSSLNYKLNLKDNYTNVDYRVRDLGLSLDLTFNLNKGSIKKNFFFKGNVSEAIHLYTKPFDEYGNTDWKTWKPVKVINHASTNILINPLNPVIENSQQGIYYIELDIVMLALQYFLWQKEKMEVSGNGISMMSFLASYPLVNMLTSFADVALWNRFVYKYIGVTIPKNGNRFPITIIDYCNHVDLFLDKYVLSLKGKNVSFPDILNTVPVLFEKSIMDLLRPPRLYPINRNNIWWFNGCRLRPFRFLFKYSREIDNHSKNKMYVESIKRELRIFLSERQFEQVLKEPLLSYCLKETNGILNS